MSDMCQWIAIGMVQEMVLLVLGMNLCLTVFASNICKPLLPSQLVLCDKTEQYQTRANLKDAG
jgi:hypothetical protein